VPFGNFIIPKPDNEEIKEKTSFTGYDYMIKFDIPYKDQSTYPCKAKVLFQDLCNQVGVLAGNVDFTNAEYMILGNPFTNNEKCREVLSCIAKLAGGFAKIGRDNKAYIVSLNVNTVVETIDGNNYFDDFSKNKQWGEVNSLILRISGTEGENTTIEDANSIVQNGLTELVIEDNIFLIDQVEREKVINPLWNKLKKLKYVPFKTEYYGYPYLDSGDKIKILDSKDNEYESYVFNHTFTFNGAYSGKIETTALTKTETKYKNTDSTKIKFRDIQRKINKMDGIIEDVIEEQTDYEHKLSQMLQDIDSITQKVENVADLTREVSGATKIQLNDCMAGELIELHIEGNNTVFDSQYLSDDLYLDDDVDLFGDSFIKITRQVKDGETIKEEIETIDLGIDTVLRQYKGVFDEYIIKDNKAQIIRRIGVDDEDNKYILENEIIEDLGELQINLTKGTNYIEILNYVANIMAKYVVINDFTSKFATTVELKSSISQMADSINLTVSKKLNKEDIIAGINLAVLKQKGEEISEEDVEKSIIQLFANILEIDADNLKVGKDGTTTIIKGIIAGLNLWRDYSNNIGRSWLTKDFTQNNNTYRSGLLIRDSNGYNSDFIFAGMPVNGESWSTGDANLRIFHNGEIKAKWFSVNGESGYFYVDYDNGKHAMIFDRYGINRYLNNGNRWSYDGMTFVDGVANAHSLFLYDAKSYNIIDGVHNSTLLTLFKLDSGSYGGNATMDVSANLQVWGTQYSNGVNNSIYVQGYEVQTNASDRRLKKRIKQCKEKAIEIIRKIKINKFEWRKPRNHNRKKVDFGYIAQDLKEVLSSLVDYNKEYDTYQINLLNLSALQTKAIQELMEENEDLKQKQETMQKQIDFLINKLNCQKELENYMKEEK